MDSQRGDPEQIPDQTVLRMKTAEYLGIGDLLLVL